MGANTTMQQFSDFCKTLSTVSLLARGGQKIVFSARHPKYGVVVIKLYFEQHNPRSQREIEIGQKSDIAATPGIFETGYLIYEGSETLYIIEEKIEGEELRKRLDRGELFSLSEAVLFLEQGLSFVLQLEQMGIVHRDIKPENIIIAGDMTAFFIDFGIARLLNQPSLTKTENVFGPHTPGYAAPEQFNNLKKDIDSRADLFSLGVVTYECLVGYNPFNKDAVSALDVLQKTETITPVIHLIPGDTQQQFMALLSSLMGKYPSRRPKNAAQAIEWLNAAKQTFVY